jgi:hypothetical protein
MKAPFDISSDDMVLILRALDHYYAYTRAVKREDRSYAILREKLERAARKPARPTSGKSARPKPRR